MRSLMTKTIDPEDVRTIEVGEAQISYHDVGSGPVLLCIHGGAPGATGWGNFGHNVAAFSKRFRTLVVDLPGFGGSDRVAAEAGTLRAHAAVFAKMLTCLGVAKAHVLGLGSGGAVAMRMAIDHADLVDRLVLVSSAGSLSLTEVSPTDGLRAIRDYYRGSGPSMAKMRHYLKVSMYDAALVTDELVAERYEESVRPSVVAAAMEKAPAHPSDAVWKELDRVTARTLVVWGRDNRVKNYDHGTFLLSRLPDAELHVFSRTGLSVPFERPRRFESLVEEFLTAD
jgi:2-hydroxy-6-oxonona-2,4-dienedioate hydrolase/4,5:9,10-diseco-3-hydroxy-5,9,17-trioxoandrosta-1(10),2-diene-4-oate hydrolase